MTATDLRELIDQGDAHGLGRALAANPSLANAEIVWGEEGGNRCHALTYLINAPFHGTCPGGQQVAMARQLLAAGADIESRGPRGQGETPLHTAVSLYETDIAALLLDHGANIEALGGCVHNGSPLVLAVHFAATPAADLLVDGGAQVFNLPLAAGCGLLDRMESFLSGSGLALTEKAGARHPADPEAEHSPLWHESAHILGKAATYAVINGRLESLDALLDRGLDPNLSVAEEGSRQKGTGLEKRTTLLHWAAWWGQPESSRRLLERGTDPATRDPEYGLSAKEWAEHRLASRWAGLTRQAEVVRILCAVDPGNRVDEKS